MKSIKQVWSECRAIFEGTGPNANSLVMNHLLPEKKLDLYAGISHDGHFMIAVGLKSEPATIRNQGSALRVLKAPRSGGLGWLHMVCLVRNELLDVFQSLCDDLIRSADSLNNEAELVSLFNKRIGQWRSLFVGRDDGLLTENEIKGLFAELTVLRELIEQGQYLPLQLIESWGGPEGRDQDFSLKCPIEVKAVGVNAEEVSISSLEQLDVSNPMVLDVLFLSEANLGGTSLSLNQLVAVITSLLESDVEAESLFYDRTLQAGWVSRPEYDEYCYRISRRLTYDVIDGFPRLTRAMVPKEIYKANYRLRFEDIASFRQRYV